MTQVKHFDRSEEKQQPTKTAQRKDKEQQESFADSENDAFAIDEHLAESGDYRFQARRRATKSFSQLST